MTPQEIRAAALAQATTLAIARAMEYKRRPSLADVFGIGPSFESYIDTGTTPMGVPLTRHHS